MGIRDRTAGLRLMQARSSQTRHGCGTQPGERAHEVGTAEPAALLRVSSLIPTQNVEGKNPPVPHGPEKLGNGIPSPAHTSVNSVSPSLPAKSIPQPSSPLQQVRKKKFAVGQTHSPQLLTAGVNALAASAPHATFALSQVNLGVLGVGSWLSTLLSPNEGDAAALILKQGNSLSLSHPRGGSLRSVSAFLLACPHDLSAHFWQKMAKVSWAHLLPLPSPGAQHGSGAGDCISLPSTPGHPAPMQEAIPLCVTSQPG